MPNRGLDAGGEEDPLDLLSIRSGQGGQGMTYFKAIRESRS
jgi:hypothetical protein